jgi:hypothetical protein
MVVLQYGAAAGQVPVTRHAGSDSVKATAGARYQAGGMTRFLLGDTWRDLWATPITVPVLDLKRFAGGLKPTKTGGGNQTRSLRFLAPDGSDYVFRLVDKDGVSVPDGWKGTVLHAIARDQVSAHHPAGAVVVAELLQAAGILHVTPILAVMPDDPLLGEFREEFAGELGMIEPYPTKPDDAPGFAGASRIIESEELRELMDSGVTGIDTRAYLATRLMDALLGDWDRHPGNWKWARMGSSPNADWIPLPRDRDKAFIRYGGIVAAGGRFSPNLMVFDGGYPPVAGLSWNSRDLDRRLLAGLERPVWDSVALALKRRITDQVIDSALRALPREYHSIVPELAAALRQRRDSLPAYAERFYRFMAGGPDIHATDAADRATILRHQDGSVEVQLQTGDDPAWFRRRFQPDETDEIRLYLHGGDDRAFVTGDVGQSLPVRIIGGNGNNQLIDSSLVGGRPGQARLYDAGDISGVEYSEPDTLFDRRPWVRSEGKLVEPGRDRGSALGPVVGVSAPGDVGLVFRAGLAQTRYGFRVRPYAAENRLTAEYATGVTGWRITGTADRRREGTPLHFRVLARMSEFEVVNFHGLGNATTDDPALSYRVEQRQWRLQPAVAWALSQRTDFSFGPVFQYSTSDSLEGNFLSSSRPYGFGDFGQAGLGLSLIHDRRDRIAEPRSGVLLQLSGDWYPAIWDVESGFGALGGAATTYYRIPVPLGPVLVLRATGRKLFGEFPFHESAFIGGRSTVRVLELQRYAGDAALTGTTELRVPLGRVPLILPLDLGVYGFADAGRVWVDGESPDGWHAGFGGGLWVGILNPTTALSLELGRYRGDSRVRLRAGLGF